MSDDAFKGTQELVLYHKYVESIPDPMSELLESYSNIPTEKQRAHVQTVRDRAYPYHPYPCLGRFRFLELDCSVHPLYASHVIPLLSQPNPPIFLDLGTCLGQDIRKIIYDTKPSLPITHLFGADLLPEFIETGYKLFCDEEKLPRSQMIAPADIFDSSPDNALSKFDGKVQILHSAAVFHLFNLDQQYEVARRCLRLLNKTSTLELSGSAETGNQASHTAAKPPGGKRALVLGSQTANVEADHYKGISGGRRYRHNGESWQKMWEDVVKEDEFKDKIKQVEVGSELQIGTFKDLDKVKKEVEAFRQREAAERSNSQEQGVVGKGGDVIVNENASESQSGNNSNKRKQIGSVEAGFRWMVWWVWVDFE